MGVQEQKTGVISSTCNPKWNKNMQFFIMDPSQDVLCLTVFDKDYFAPNGKGTFKILNVSVQMVNTDRVRCYTVSNKNTHLADFETCVFRGYLQHHLSYEKVFYIYLHSCLKNFQMKK